MFVHKLHFRELGDAVSMIRVRHSKAEDFSAGLWWFIIVWLLLLLFLLSHGRYRNAMDWNMANHAFLNI